MNKLVSFFVSHSLLIAYVSMEWSQGKIESWENWFLENIVLLGLLISMSVVFFGALSTLFSALRAQQERAAAERGEILPSPWQLFKEAMYKPLPLAQEPDMLLDHDYDGIRELDNSLPPLVAVQFLCIHRLRRRIHGLLCHPAHPFLD